MFCTNCGKELHEGDRFCANCGTKTREESPKPKEVSQDVVFNPPFKAEAEQRTAEIYKGFASEAEETPKPRRTESVSFDWNLEGFPQEQRKTEEINFNWDTVIERRNRQKQEEMGVPEVPVVDKIELKPAEASHAAKSVEAPKSPEAPAVEAHAIAKETAAEVPTVAEARVASETPDAEVRAEKVRVRTPLFVEPVNAPKEAGLEEILQIDEIPELILPTDISREKPAVEIIHDEKPVAAPVVEPAAVTFTAPPATPSAAADAPAENEDDEPPMTAEELERDLFGENYRGLGSMSPDDSLKSTSQLEKFYTYNRKNEEFQQLLDQEYARLHGMEQARRPDAESLEFTWATTLFPENQTLKNAEEKLAVEIQENTDNTDNSDNAEVVQISQVIEPQEISVPSDTIDFSAVREEARMIKRLEATIDSETPEPVFPSSGEDSDGELAAGEVEFVSEVESAGDAAECSGTDGVGESGECCAAEAGEARECCEASEVGAAGTDEAGDTATSEDAASGVEASEVGSEVAASGVELAASGCEVECEEGEQDEGECEEVGDQCEGEHDEEYEDEHDEKAKLRYSDVFPREVVDGHSDDSSSGSTDTVARKVIEAFPEEDDDDEPKKMNIFIKLIIFLLVLLILAEGVVLLARFIAPDSAFSQQADAIVESIIDKVTGGDGKVSNSDDGGSEPVSGEVESETYLSAIIADKIELPDSIGKVAEDASLKYDLKKDYAFEEVSDTEDFENGDWTTDKDGEAVTYAEGIVDTITSYYGQWQATNRDTSLIGINKLEIGEIRTGEGGYYVLCRLTFAGADGEEVVKYVTACVKISKNSMLLNEIKEEKI